MKTKSSASTAKGSAGASARKAPANGAVIRKMTIRQKAPSPARTGDTLSAKQLKELTGKLLALRTELLEKISGKANVFHIGFESESLIKGDDAEVAEKQRANNAALQELDFLKARLTMVSRALMKIENNCYGVCEETEEPIGYERLSVVPWARYSVHVQEKRELRQREFKVNRLRSEV